MFMFMNLPFIFFSSFENRGNSFVGKKFFTFPVVERFVCEVFVTNSRIFETNIVNIKGHIFRIRYGLKPAPTLNSVHRKPMFGYPSGRSTSSFAVEIASAGTHKALHFYSFKQLR